MHGVYLGEVAPQRPPHPHLDPADGLQLLHGGLQRGVALVLAVLLQPGQGQWLVGTGVSVVCKLG